jgi:hypothetical protein
MYAERRTMVGSADKTALLIGLDDFQSETRKYDAVVRTKKTSSSLAMTSRAKLTPRPRIRQSEDLPR